ncbi:unnamed protein product [Schistosoma margrebowiei]|uniref:Uncharacterized protein n=1 Tax=Schistosoma margrebowiei TaxID=48269 RepID=A0A183LYY2_9TREM|nr:unnamed protein product [Schistosoma margrebowiei]
MDLYRNRRRKKKIAINNSRTRTDKVKARTEYTEANKEVKRSNRVDKRKYVKYLSATVEKAAREENTRQLCGATKKLAGKYSKPEIIVKDKRILTIAIQEQRSRWVEHFEELLDKSTKLNPPEMKAVPTDFHINVTPTTIDKIRRSSDKSKVGNQPDQTTYQLEY